MAMMHRTKLQQATTNDHIGHLRRASSVHVPILEGKLKLSNDQICQSRSLSSRQVSPQLESVSAPIFRGLLMEYYAYGPGQRLKDIYLSSREGESFVIPVRLAVQLSPRLREFVQTLMIEGATRGYPLNEISDKPRQTLSVPCSTVVLKTLVEFLTTKVELEQKLAEEGIHMNLSQQQEHWRDYIYSRVAWTMDLDDFADDILQVADFLGMGSLYDLMTCCFRLRL